jgi:uncharacterized protein (TIGR02677 family)
VDRGDSNAGQRPLPSQWALPGGLILASYLTAEPAAAAQYRLLVDVLLDEQDRALTGVSRPSLDVLLRDRLAAVLDGPAGPWLAALPLDRRLDQLVAWGVADQWPGPAGVSHYQLTEPAARLHRAVRALTPDMAGPPDPTGAGEDPGASVAASVAPPVLAGHLARLADAVPGRPAEAAEAWSVVRTTAAAMAAAAAGWQARLAAALAGAADPARVAALQDTLRRYVDVWGTGVDRHSGPIAAHAAGLLDAGPAAWRPAALHSLGAAATEDQLSALLADYRDTLTALLAWFGPGDNRARRLRRQMRDVVVPLVHGQRALAAVRGQLSQRTDLLALAGALERTATDDGAWALWCTATGLFAARHLPFPAPQPTGPAASTSFWNAAPVPPSVLAPTPAGLTAAGDPPASAAAAGRVARMPDRSAAKAAARAAASARQAAADQTRHAIQTRSGLPLSGWTGLDTGQLDVLLSFLAALAGARPGQDGSRTVRTPDGRWTVRAEAAPDGAPPAVIGTPAGQLVHPDLRLTITAGAAQ